MPSSQGFMDEHETWKINSGLSVQRPEVNKTDNELLSQRWFDFGQYRRRWANIEPTLGQHIMFKVLYSVGAIVLTKFCRWH